MTNKRKNPVQSTSSHGRGKKDDGVSAKRPKRQIVSKNVDQSAGLSWKEETDLKKALYASLQESKRLSRGQDDESMSPELKMAHHQGRITRGLMGAPTRKPSSTGRYGMDDSSQDSGASSSTQESKKTTVHAQRKFAQGHSQPCTPSTTPVKVHTTPVKLFSKRAKTEDFLTFLCLRGSSVLPPHLDFFGYSRDDSQAGDSSRPNTPGQGVRSDSGETRESTPDLSSSSDSDMRDELPELANLIMKNQQTPTRKAARASASTPETARGLASIRPSMAKKVGKVPAKALLKRSKTLLAKPNKMSPRGKRALLRHQRYPTKPSTCSQSRNNAKSSDAESSKPVRASATPSKKRITPQSLPIGSLPKFYIDDSDSSVQSRDSKEMSSRRGKVPVVSKPKQSVKQKGKVIKLKGQLKSGTLPKVSAKLGKNLSSGKKITDKKRIALKSKPRAKAQPGKKLTRLKEKAKADVRKKRKATLSKNYAEDIDDDLESVEDMEVSKPAKVRKTALPKNGRDKKSESRRKIVAASLAKMAASKKLSKIKKAAQTKKQKTETEIKKDVPSTVARKSRQAKAAKIKESDEAKERTRKLSLKSSSSPISSPKRGRPRSLTRTPKDKAEVPTHFPTPEDGGHSVEVPTFYPSTKEFQDPYQYIASIRSKAEPYGMCKVVPPPSWKPECKVNDELRFTSQLQYIHKMQNRWGPNVQQMECIRKHLASIDVELDQPPLVGGIEVDLPKLHQTLQVFGGAQNVADKKTWIKVADAMKIPKLAQDRATKLYDAYCKYLLSYDTLSYEEKTKLEIQVWTERQKKQKSQKALDDSVVKGKSTSLGDFNRVARNTVSMWFKDDPSVEQVESEYWKLVQDGQNHVVVQCGHVDTRSQGSAFPVKRDSPCARHGWNFNVLAQNSKSVLKAMGAVTGVTIPTLHIGMLFTTSCWSTDLHLLPYIQYLHTGADTVWYSVPQSEQSKFKSALTAVVPEMVTDDDTWLSEDTVMVSPDTLSQKGVSLGRCVQKPGQFMVVFSHCHTATVSCGYSISESVHFAYPDWIPVGVEASKRLNKMGEPELFSVEGFLCNLIKESNNKDILSIALPQLKTIIECEGGKARQLMEDGLKVTKQMAVANETVQSSTGKRKSVESVGRDDCVCDICKKVCHLFMVVSDSDDSVFCLDHAAPFVQRKKNFKGSRLLYRYTEEELDNIVKSAEEDLGITGDIQVESPEKSSSSPKRRSVSLRSSTSSSSS